VATRFEALDELLDDALELPVPGRDGTKRVYRIPSPAWEDGLRIQRLTNMAARLFNGEEVKDDTVILDDQEELDLIADALGPASDEMVADGVDWAWRKHAGLTAVIWIAQGAEIAQRYWAAAGDPTKLAAPSNREQRRAAAKTSGSAKASGTRSRASTSGSKGRPAGKTARKASQD
jgi:hypothetical protein